MNLRLAVVAAPLLALPVVIGTAETASALSCVMPVAIAADAESLFAGRIVDTRDHRIHVEVREIWRGDPVAASLWLDVGLEGWWAGADGRELPDGWAPEEEWLFAPDDGSVNPCSAWPRTGFSAADEEQLRPEAPTTPYSSAESTPGNQPATGEPREPADDGESDEGFPVVPVALGAAAGALIVGAGVLLRRRRQR